MLAGIDMAFYILWKPRDAGLALIRFSDEAAALDLARELLAEGHGTIEFGSLTDGQQSPILSGDELRRACERPDYGGHK
jgi:hypothetical protein